MELIALQQIQDIGTIEEGQRFIVNDERAEQLIKDKMAIRSTARVVWDKLTWPGAAVCIIASGPSLTKSDCELVQQWRERDLQKHKVIVINTSYRMAFFADILYACDGRWWDRYYHELNGFAGQLWTQDERAAKNFRNIHYVRSETKIGLNRKVGVINQCHNSGYQAVGLAYQAGVEKIILLGFDMCEDRYGKGHWHPDHPARLHSFPNYKIWIDSFKIMAKDLQQLNIEVVNATRKTDMHCFKEQTLEEALL